MLNIVKLALRIMGDDFDDEINLLIDDCLSEMAGLGIKDTQNDSQVRTAVIAYCKWKFGHSEEKEDWHRIYNDKLEKLQVMAGYTGC